MVTLTPSREEGNRPFTMDRVPTFASVAVGAVSRYIESDVTHSGGRRSPVKLIRDGPSGAGASAR